MKPLTEAVRQFMYSHMAQSPFRKELLKTIEDAENQYIERIHELEKRLQHRDQLSERELLKEREEKYGGRNWSDFD